MSSTSFLGTSMGAPASALWGPVLKLPGRLDGLLHSSSMLPKGTEEEILLIKLDLEKIVDILSNLEDDDHANARMVRCWTKEVRELSYDMEDFIDQYEHASRIRLTLRCRKITLRRHFLKKGRSMTTIPWLHEKLRQRLWMANKIREFSLRVQEVLQRHDRYRLLGAIAGAASSARCIDARSGSQHHTSHGHDNDLVGINGAMKKLEEWLMPLHHEDERKLKVVSIVGFGGVGKTTLANELYRKLGWQFDCRAFMRTSQRPDIRRILIGILYQIRPHHPPVDCTVHGLISSVRAHLQDKRYLIIVDDLWAVSTWDVIKCALPDGNSGSRILTTTESEDLGLQSCGYDPKCVFKMQPLGEDDSRKLFFGAVFGPNHECPPELQEVSYSIIRKCGGLPLAILTIASILASQLGKLEKWDQINKSLGYSLIVNPTLEGMKEVLAHGYYSLPHHLKACMLYIGMFQEDDIIWKDDLLNQWTAEGFFSCAKDHQDKECSRDYFDELVGRKMLQPVHINDKGEVLSCVIHRMVLNLVIAYKSIEENFVTAIHHSQDPSNTLGDKVRRLSLQYGNAEDATPPTNMRLSQVRTLAFFGVFKCLPSIANFRLLQVLILHFWGDKESISMDLTTISKLFRLRYLKVTSNVTLELHTQIGCLQSLETLSIDATINAVPSEIAHLPGLLNLRVPAETILPNEIVQANLRDLQLTCSTVQANYLDVSAKILFLLTSILGKLKNLKSITLEPTGHCFGNYVNEAAAAPRFNIIIPGDNFTNVSYFPALLNRFEFSPRVCIFSCLPKCIGQLQKLCILKIGVLILSQDDIDVLGGLPALSVLLLDVLKKPADRIVIQSKRFSVLTYLKFECCDPWLKFEVDAMPNLCKLELCVNADEQSSIPVGMEHLSGLKEVSVKISGVCPDDSSRRDTELAFRDAIKTHATFPRVVVQFVNQIGSHKRDKSSVTLEQHEYGTSKLHESLDEKDSNVRVGITGYGQEETNKQAIDRFGPSEWSALLLLRNKLDNQHDDLTSGIPVVDVFSVDPGKLKDIGDGKQPWVFFCPMQEKGKSSAPVEAPSGCWHAHGLPVHIYSAQKIPVGQMKTLEFYLLSGTKTGWLMKEFVAFQDATASAALTLRGEMSLCQLYAEPTVYNPAGHLLGKGHGAAAQYKNADREVSASPSSEVTQVVSRGSATSPYERKTLPKRRSTQARVSTVRKHVMALDDGMSWRKYGQKDVLGSKYARGYYRCTYGHSQGCQAKKQVQRTDEDPSLYDVVYQGSHTCDQAPQVAAAHLDGQRQSRPEPAAASADHAATADEAEKSSVVRKEVMTRRGHDGYSWRKYGEKPIDGAQHPRSYFKCAERGCPARKSVQPTGHDSYTVVYEGAHTCGEIVLSDEDSDSGYDVAASLVTESSVKNTMPLDDIFHHLPLLAPFPVMESNMVMDNIDS